MSEKSFRAFIEQLKTKGDVLRITHEIDPVFEISGMLKILDERGGPAVIFEAPKGYSVRAAGNVMGRRERIAMAMGIQESELIEEYLHRKEHPIPAKLVSGGPVKEIVLRGDIDILGSFPVVTYSEKDSNPYITAGVVFAKDPQSEKQTMGIHRLQVMGKNKLTVLLLSPPVPQYHQYMEAQNKPLDVAIAVGLDPLLLFSSVAWMPEGNKLELAGSLYGEPVETVKAENSDLQVPAYAEIVLEGKILPGIREKDGPFGETSGYYVPYESPVIEIATITHRKNPLFQVLHPWSNEAFVLLMSWEAEMLKMLRNKFPEIQRLNLMPDTVGAHAVVSISTADKGKTRQAMVFMLANNTYIKRVVMVDDDIDVYNPREVEWALATRFQPDTDLVVLPDLLGSPLDPSTHPGYLTSKMGMDATKPSDAFEKFEKISVPPAVRKHMENILSRYWNG